MRPVVYVSNPYFDTPPEPGILTRTFPNMEQSFRYLEKLLEKYPGNPYILLRFASIYEGVDPGTALFHKQEALAQLAALDLEDEALESHITEVEASIDENARANHHISEMSGPGRIIQVWKRTEEHTFPETQDIIDHPSGHGQVQTRWRDLFPHGSRLFTSYLCSLAIETNHIESTFLMTVNATQDLIRRGIAEGVVNTQLRSKIRDPKSIKSILNDTLAAYAYLQGMVDDPDKLTPEAICEIHRRVMDNARFQGKFIPAGFTRSVTRSTVYVQTKVPGTEETGAALCCPPWNVDDQLYIICQQVRKILAADSESENPFATASWLHLMLATCHPFNDGNGRVTRLVASIPLLRRGYPPISIPLHLRNTYFDSIHNAYNGDHRPLMECILDGMKWTISNVIDVTSNG